ncbi:MAG: sugar phosphate isomerase/epimerase [Verrucomicrobiae bacterium]|nr:sugar phosphate isomerase/epimerase [Verrucomicrobiae bacterium]
MFSEEPIERVCARAKRMGFDGIDIWCPFGRCRHLDDVLERLGPEGLGRVLSANGLALSNITVYKVGFSRYAELLGGMGGGLVVRESQYGRVAPGEVRGRIGALFESLKPDIALAEKHGCRLAIENHSGAILNSPDSFRAFMEMNPSPGRVGIALAPYHLQKGGFSVEEVIAVCGSQIWFVYAWQHAEGAGQLPGGGPADFRPWLKALGDSGYSGFLSPFTHGEMGADAMETAVTKACGYLDGCMGVGG